MCDHPVEIADRSNDEDILNQAAEALEAALEIFRPDSYPIQWASAQNRLGMVLYKLDLKNGDAETLKKSLNAYQAAVDPGKAPPTDAASGGNVDTVA